MTNPAAEFAPIRVGSRARLPVVIAPLLLVAVIGLSVVHGPAPATGTTQAGVPLPAVRVPTWSVPRPNEVRTKGVRLMRLARLVDPYER
jgi:hypothetical protein